MTGAAKRLVIVGTGQAGTRAALTLVAAGAQGVVLIGDEPHAPYERPPVSKEVLAGTKSLADVAIDRFGHLEAGGVKIMTGTVVRSIHRDAKRVILADGTSVDYDRLLLATGRSARTPPEAAGNPRVLTLRSAADVALLRQRLPHTQEALLVGGGLIGLEVASFLAASGIRTKVVDVADRLMARAVPPEISELALMHHSSVGIQFRLGLSVASYGADGAVTFADGSTQRADLILLAIGSVPNTALAAQSGLAVDRGIIVDTCLTTSDPAILAAGDVVEMRLAGSTRLFENWTAADAQGAVAARNMLGAREAWTEVPWFWSDQGNFGIQGAGDPQGTDRILRRYADGGRVVFTRAETGALLGVFGAGSPFALRDVRFGQQLLARGVSPCPGELADAAIPLKQILRSRSNASADGRGTS